MATLQRIERQGGKPNLVRKLGRAITLLVFATSWVATPVFGDYHPYPARYTPQQLASDYQLFMNALHEMHAGLFVHQGPEAIATHLYRGLHSLEKATTERELHLALLRVIHEIGDGHTSARTSEASLEYFDRQPAYLPFRLIHLGGKTFIHRDYSDNLSHLVGAEVLTIEELLMKEVVDRMVRLTPGDGASLTGRLFRLSDSVTFGRLYQRMFGPTDRFRLQVRRLGQTKIEQFTAPAISGPTVDQRFQERYPEEYEGRSRWALSFPAKPAKTAVLRISFFGGRDLPDFIDSSFRRFADEGTEHLVLDLRGNVGGLEIHGQRLVAYLVSRPFKFYDRAEVNARSFQMGRLSANNPTVFSEEEAVPGPNGKLLLTPKRRSFLAEYSPLLPRFAGKLTVLIDGGTFSTAADVVTAIHRNREARFVGEEPGGNYYGNTSGSTKTLYLPHTKTRVRIPIERYVSATEGTTPRDRGLAPDLPIVPSIEELLNGTDPALDLALGIEPE